MEKYKNKIAEIANTYHDRSVLSEFTGPERECPCCERAVISTVSIEHDSCDYSKDLSVCGDCYFDIYKWWANNKTGKIFPGVI